MDAVTMEALGKVGAAAAIAFGAMGSAIGTGTAGMAAVGAWKKCYIQDKAAPFLLLIFIGAPLSQTIYGMILMNAIGRAASEGAGLWPAMIAAGVLGGIAMAMSAMWQGRAGAAGADALAETGQGFGNYLMTIGVVETVALFVLVFIQAAIR
jgi:V/A-type H+-transporting ATPase subunit K